MTNPKYAHHCLLIDRTGSMKLIAEETQQGITAYIREVARASERVTISLYEFDAWLENDSEQYDYSKRMDLRTQVNCVCSFVEAAKFPGYTLVPRGNTPLLDAQGMTITAEGGKLAAMAEEDRPGKVVFVTATDGQENWSREWDTARVAALVRQQTEQYGWQFAYIGANQDAFAQGRAMHVNTTSIMNYRATSAGTQSAWTASAAAATRYVGGQSASITYTDEEREAAQSD